MRRAITQQSEFGSPIEKRHPPKNSRKTVINKFRKAATSAHLNNTQNNQNNRFCAFCFFAFTIDLSLNRDFYSKRF